jgi:hypothetical protein
MSGTNLSQYPLHLNLGAAAVEQPELAGREWYASYGGVGNEHRPR